MAGINPVFAENNKIQYALMRVYCILCNK